MASISDEWQEVGDTGSVRSLNSNTTPFQLLDSDEELNLPSGSNLPLVPRDREEAASAVTSVLQPVSPSRSPDTFENSARDFTTREEDEYLAALSVYGTGKRQIQRDGQGTENTQRSSQSLSTREWPRDDLASSATTADLLISHQELNSLNTCIAYIGEILCNFHGHTMTITDPLTTIVSSLQQQVQTLQPIVFQCVEQYKVQGGVLQARDIPLNGNLVDWLRSARIVAEDVRNELLATQSRDDPVQLSDNEKRLREYMLTMQEFLSILRADFDESRIGTMAFPTHPMLDSPGVGASSPGTSKSAVKNNAPHPTVVCIRRELYNIQDHLKAIEQVLDPICNEPMEMVEIDANLSPLIWQSFASVKELRNTVATVLTNHGSDWIDSETGLGKSQQLLSYAEFASLDPDMLHDVDSHLVRLYEDLEGHDGHGRKSLLKAMLRRHQVVMLTEGGQLKELDSMMSFLNLLLRPRKRL